MMSRELHVPYSPALTVITWTIIHSLFAVGPRDTSFAWGLHSADDGNGALTPGLTYACGLGTRRNGRGDNQSDNGYGVGQDARPTGICLGCPTHGNMFGMLDPREYVWDARPTGICLGCPTHGNMFGMRDRPPPLQLTGRDETPDPPTTKVQYDSKPPGE